MNCWKYIAIIVAGTGMIACQSQTEQAPVAPAETTAPEATQHTMVQPAARITTPAVRMDVEMPTPTGHIAKSVSPVPENTVSRAASMPKQKTVPVPPKIETSSHAIKEVVSAKVDMSALKKCKICHNFTPKSKVGPGLGKGMMNGKMEPGDFGRIAGTHPGFHYKFVKYIPAGKAWVWDEMHIRKWICNSMDAIREFTGNKAAKTKMPPQHVCEPAKQDAVIAALKSIS